MPRRITPPASDTSGGSDQVPGQTSASSASAPANHNATQNAPASAAYRFVPTLASTTTLLNHSSGPLPSLVAVAPALPLPVALDPPRRVPLTLAPANAAGVTPGYVGSDGGSGSDVHSASQTDEWIRAYSSRRVSNVGADDALAHSLVQRYRASSFSSSSSSTDSLASALSDAARSASVTSSVSASHAPSAPPGFMLVEDLHLGDVLLVQASAASSSGVAVAQATSRVFAADTTLRGHASSVHACIVVAIDRQAADGADRSASGDSAHVHSGSGGSGGGSERVRVEVAHVAQGGVCVDRLMDEPTSHFYRAAVYRLTTRTEVAAAAAQHAAAIASAARVRFDRRAAVESAFRDLCVDEYLPTGAVTAASRHEYQARCILYSSSCTNNLNVNDCRRDSFFNTKRKSWCVIL
jgi:hypothetical protein